MGAREQAESIQNAANWRGNLLGRNERREFANRVHRVQKSGANTKSDSIVERQELKAAKRNCNQRK